MPSPGSAGQPSHRPDPAAAGTGGCVQRSAGYSSRLASGAQEIDVRTADGVTCRWRVSARSLSPLSCPDGLTVVPWVVRVCKVGNGGALGFGPVGWRRANAAYLILCPPGGACSYFW